MHDVTQGSAPGGIIPSGPQLVRISVEAAVIHADLEALTLAVRDLVETVKTRLHLAAAITMAPPSAEDAGKGNGQ